jgi:hypothetical protein
MYEQSTYHVTEDEANRAPVLDGEDEGLAFAHALGAFCSGGHATLLQAGNGNFPLAVGETGSGRRKVDEDEVRDQSNEDGCCTLDNKQPAPALVASGAVHTARDSTRKETTESTRKDGSRDVDTKALRLFFTLVPGGHEQQHSGPETGLKHTDEDSEDDQVLVVLDSGHAAGQGSPDGHDAREVDGRSDPYNQHVRGHFEDDICDCSRQCQVQARCRCHVPKNTTKQILY